MSTAAKVFAFIVSAVLIAQSYMIYELKNSVDHQQKTVATIEPRTQVANVSTDINNDLKTQKISSADSHTLSTPPTEYQTNWDPFKEFHAMEREFDKIFSKMHSHFANDPFFKEAYSTLPRRSSIDISSDDSKYIIKIDIPGVESSNIQTTINNNILIVKAEVHEVRENNTTTFISKERYSNLFQRSVYLADDADISKMQSEYKNGLLTITIPKKVQSNR